MVSSTVFPGYFDTTSLIVIVCSALAGYNALELILLIFTTFSVYKGLYFWSLVIATIGILPYVIGLSIFYFELTITLIGYILNNVGWIATVVGQSVILYSRLGIVLGRGHQHIMVWVKWMIILAAFLFYIPTTVIVFGSHYATDHKPFSRAYLYMEKIQMTGFCVEEFILSGLYVWKTLDILQNGEKKQARRILWQLFIINIVIILMDIALLVLEYLNLFIPEVAFKALAYSVKLKLEFAILSKLVEYSQSTHNHLSNALDDSSYDDRQQFDGLRRVPTSATLISSDSRPQWMLASEKKKNLQHLENSDSIETARSSSAQTESSQPASNAALTCVSTADGRLDRRESDLMYADAIRVVSGR